jgi:hypothetical protein
VTSHQVLAAALVGADVDFGRDREVAHQARQAPAQCGGQRRQHFQLLGDAMFDAGWIMSR